MLMRTGSLQCKMRPASPIDENASAYVPCRAMYYTLQNGCASIWQVIHRSCSTYVCVCTCNQLAKRVVSSGPSRMHFSHGPGEAELRPISFKQLRNWHLQVPINGSQCIQGIWILLGYQAGARFPELHMYSAPPAHLKLAITCSWLGAYCIHIYFTL